jgi:hypothetical protein
MECKSCYQQQSKSDTSTSSNPRVDTQDAHEAFLHGMLPTINKGKATVMNAKDKMKNEKATKSDRKPRTRAPTIPKKDRKQVVLKGTKDVGTKVKVLFDEKKWYDGYIFAALVDTNHTFTYVIKYDKDTDTTEWTEQKFYKEIADGYAAVGIRAPKALA